MRSITLHGIGEQLDKRIREIAAREGVSLNKTMKALLAEALGLSSAKTNRREDFSDIFGVWSRADLDEFNAATGDLQQVDERDWK